MHGRVRSPRPPRFGHLAQRGGRCRSRSADETQIAGRKSVGPAQRAQGNVAARPIADATNCQQLLDDRLGVGALFKRDQSATHRPRQIANALGSRFENSQTRHFGKRGGGQSCGVRSQPLELRERSFDRLAESVRQTTGQRCRRRDGNLLPEDRPHRQLETAECSRHAQAGSPLDEFRQARVARQM